ncbi:alpha/beta hydrolase [Leuconostocaceae bacterium ESL0958]|nr:alpha/beta hydrolase [Leuconostocaceae bacterium ESL0958]
MAKLITTDGVAIDYQDAGGSGQAVLLLSGFSARQAQWVSQVAALQAAGFRVITLDWRSHGRSERTSRNLRISRFAADLRELIATLALDQFVLLGHSMGASIIWAYLSLFGEQGLAKVVLVDESPKLLNEGAWTAGIRDLTWDNFHQLAPVFLKQKMTVSPIDDRLRQQLQEEKTRYPTSFELLYPLLKNHLLADWRENIKETTVPTLFFVGAESPLWRPGYETEFADFFNQDAQVVRVAASGHLPQLEQPAFFNKKLVQFLS